MSSAHEKERRKPPPLRAVRAFAAAARHMSLTRAADELAVTQSAVSRQVRELERDLGVELFRRQGRKLRLTAEGRAFAQAAGEAIDRLTDYAAVLRARHASPVVTLGTLPSVAARWLAPRLADFVASHPDIDLRIATSPQLAELGSGDIDAAIRYGRGDWPGLTAIRLADEELLPVCSPEYLRRNPVDSAADLARRTLLQADLPDQWRDWFRAAGAATDGIGRGLRFDDANALLQAAADGLGVALGRSLLVAEDLRSGRLVVPLDLRIPASYSYWFVVSAGRENDAQLARIRDWLRRQFPGAA